MSENVAPRSVVLYTVVVAVASLLAFATLIYNHPNARSNETAQPLGARDASENPKVAVVTFALMFSAGVIGGSLYSFRGLVKHSSRKDYTRNHDVSYWVRPFSAGISGLFVFFLLLAGAITLNIGGGARPPPHPGWTHYPGVLPYLAFALLAGYGSHELQKKLKDLADSLFAVRKSGDTSKQNSGAGGKSQPKSQDDDKKAG